VLSQALSLYRRHFGALVLTCAVALLPASLLAVGAVMFGVASLGDGGLADAPSHTRQVQEKQHDLREKPPPAAEQETRARQLGREALEGGPSSDVLQILRRFASISYAIVIFATLLLTGLFLAHAAAVPLVLDLVEGRPTGPAHAWAVVGGRIGPLLATGLTGAFLVAIGALFFIIPGVVLAAGFSLAPPLAILENVSGRLALERSWRHLRGRWGQVLAMWALILLFSALASGVAFLLPFGPWRLLASGLVRIVLYPLPIAGLVLIYRDAAQYMRRISAPG
jgi:hypothetical protein